LALELSLQRKGSSSFLSEFLFAALKLEKLYVWELHTELVLATLVLPRVLSSGGPEVSVTERC